MKQISKVFFYIDESGSPDFFGKRKRPLWFSEDFQPVLILGMLETQEPRRLQKEVKGFSENILSDPLFNSIYSVSQPGWYLHAKDDHPEVRIKFFEFIRQLDYVECYVIIARKIPELFISKHNGNASEFYFDVLHNLVKQYHFQPNCHYQFYLSRRDSANTKPFTEAVQKVISKHVGPNGDPVCTYKCDIVRSADCAELCVLDYLLWAVQRYVLKEERRYFTAMEGRIKLVYDVYGSGPGDRIYTSSNPFDLNKAGKFLKLKK
ncbi:MAG: hypothetical protein CMN32_13985 [Saprospirales bacterium]|nr:hypothetical protein [Saprospirales bacterium]